MRSSTSVRAPLSNGYTSGPSPCERLSRSPWWGVTPTTTAASLSRIGHYCPSQLARSPGRSTRFPGSCLVTGMGSGWLPNTFPLTGGLRTGPSIIYRYRWPTAGTLRVHQPPIFADLQFSWHPRPRMPAVGWSCLTFANHRLTPAHPFLNVRLLEVGLLLTTRSCPLEADQPKVAWFLEPPG
jgi:hypothetical protein